VYVVGSDVLVINSVIPLVANDYIEVMAVASANSEHQITFTATSGSGATAVPNIPSHMKFHWEGEIKATPKKPAVKRKPVVKKTTVRKKNA